MQMNPPTAAPVVWGPELHAQPVLDSAQHVLFAGAPPQCVGFVVLCNRQKERVRVQQLSLLVNGLELGKSSCCEPEPPPTPVEGVSLSVSTAQRSWPIALRAKLAACESREVRIVLPIPPSTPAGTYPATLVDETGTLCAASIQVHELRATRIHPGFVSSGVTPGECLSFALHVRNQGNVPTEIPPGVIVRLSRGDENWHRYFHSAVARNGNKGHQQVLDHFLANMARHEPSPVKGRIVSGAGELAPNDARLVTLELPVPSKLPVGCYFNGIARIGHGVLNLSLHTLKAGGPDSEPTHEEVVQ